MALVIADRVRETTTTTGTGAVTLAGAYTSFQSFLAAVGNGNSTYYTIASAVTGEWEVGIGTYTSASNTLSRTTVLASSNAGSLVNFSSGAKDVFVTQPAERSILVQSAGSGLFSGVAAFTANGVPYANSTSTLTTGSGLTFDGTTLSASNISSAGSWTFSGGTANGVLYLNGSKVATSGTALTFDGANLLTSGSINAGLGKFLAFSASAASGSNFSLYGDTSTTVLNGPSGGVVQFNIANSEQMRLTSTGLGIGTSSPGFKLDVDNGSAGFVAKFKGGTRAAYVYTDNNAAYISTDTGLYTAIGLNETNDYFNVYTNNTERMRLDSSGNLGIGTTSSGAKLHVAGEQLIQPTTVANAKLSMRHGSVASNNYFEVDSSSNTIFGTANAERMRLDASGNLGLGVTPSAWLAYKAFQIGQDGSVFADSGSSEMVVGQNVRYDGSFKYITTQAAARYRVYNGTHAWFTAPSGTAGNAITFTQAMTLDASGNLLIGATSSPFPKLYVSDGTVGAGLAPYAGGSIAYAGTWTNHAFGFVTNGSERMRIDSSGNLGIGTSSPASRLHVVGAGTTSLSRVVNTDSFAGGTNFTAPHILIGSGNDTTGNVTRFAMYVGSGAQVYLDALMEDGVTTYSSLLFRTRSAGGVTEKMRINSDGNLGLGVTPSAWGAGVKAFQFNSQAALFSTSAAITALSNNLYFDGTNNRLIATAAGARYYQNANSHVWDLIASGTAGGLATITQAMTLDASGNLLVGTTTPLTAARAVFAGGNVRVNRAGMDVVLGDTTTEGLVGTLSNHAFAFYTNNTERARIDSSGNLLVGNSVAANVGTTGGLVVVPNSGQSYNLIGHTSGTASGSAYYYFFYAGSSIGSITQSGTTAVLYNVTSDQRLKENIADADSASTLIDSLQVRKFDWKADGNHQRYGFVAQELVTVAPEAVHQPADPEEMMAVDYSKLVPMLVKEIQSLRKRLADAGIA